MARIKYYDTSTNSWKYADEMLTYPVATTTSDGLMSSTDKIALSGKEDKGKLTINGTEYGIRVVTTDDGGQEGYITFVV